MNFPYDSHNMSVVAKFHFIHQLLKLCHFETLEHNTLLPPENNTSSYLRCPRTFDGLACWDTTPAGGIAYQPCPGYVVGFDPARYAYKRCMSNGSWYEHPSTSKTWTNYTSCVNYEDLTGQNAVGESTGEEKNPKERNPNITKDFRYVVNDIYVAGYSISVVALIISLAIFLYFKVLRCIRTKIHMHLFCSFTLNNVLWIVWYKTVVNTVSVVQDNPVWCQALHILTNYFMVTSYFWMFCEGLHLHIALVVVFVRDHIAMRWFMGIGWGLSLVITTAYAGARLLADETERCWTDQSEKFWIIVAPVLVSLIASFVFLINVVRVLLTKLHPRPPQHISHALKKAARAALILIPLFGLHFILIPLRPSPDAPWEKYYQVVSALLTSLQGLCLAVLFCFTNYDVTQAANNLLDACRRPNEEIAMTGMEVEIGAETGGESVAAPRENIV